MEKSHSVQVELIYSFLARFVPITNMVDKLNNLRREWLKVSIKRKPLPKKVIGKAENRYYLKLLREVHYPIHNL
jgi:hypothetical protein